MIDISGPIKLIRAQGRAAYPYCHCLYVDAEVKAVFDTGAGLRAFSELDIAAIDLVLYSHFHPDHTHGHEFFHQASYCIHGLDYPPMVSLEQFFFYTGMQLWEQLTKAPKQDYGQMMQARHPDPDFPDVTPGEKRVDRTFQDGEVIDFGRTQATVVHTPGHTPGHCSFFFEKEGVLFSGDIDLIRFGPWYGSYLSNVDDFINSILKLKALQPRVLVSCHRHCITENIDRELDAYLKKILEREKRILEALHQSVTLDELAGKGLIYKHYPHAYYVFWEKLMLLKHLERLERKGLVSQEERVGTGGVWSKNP